MPESPFYWDSFSHESFLSSLNTRRVPVAAQHTAGLYLHFQVCRAILGSQAIWVIRKQCFPVYVFSPRNSRESYSQISLFPLFQKRVLSPVRWRFFGMRTVYKAAKEAFCPCSERKCTPFAVRHTNLYFREPRFSSEQFSLSSLPTTTDST